MSLLENDIVIELKRLVGNGHGVDAIKKVVTQFTGAYHYRVMVGQEQGETTGVPIVLSAIQKPDYGKYYFYKRSTAPVGSEVLHKGVRYTVVVNHTIRGTQYLPNSYYFIALAPTFVRKSLLTKL